MNYAGCAAHKHTSKHTIDHMALRQAYPSVGLHVKAQFQRSSHAASLELSMACNGLVGGNDGPGAVSVTARSKLAGLAWTGAMLLMSAGHMHCIA